jgi:hypothetical protein
MEVDALGTLGSPTAHEIRVIEKIQTLTKKMAKLKLSFPQALKNVEIDSLQICLYRVVIHMSISFIS